MKKISMIIFLVTASFAFTFGQSSPDSISMYKVLGGYQFYKNGKRLKMNQLVYTFKTNAQAYQQIKSARSTNTIASIIGGVGGFMVGWPLGTAIGGGKPNWTMAGIGAGLIVVAIPISNKFNKQAKQAVTTYNGGLKTSSFWDKNELRLSFSENRVGLILKF